ncbi:hypothetical protein SAMN05518668_1013 [Sphingobium sp. YR657]|uniref:Uncharacterized protein n=1 Tax=Sphingobium yanoikuyae ATCC 51230 TaxID=883163 RepID=K9D2J3_SPHYA|nr:hypothetical protein HMPREF9718_04585 [Sphingobium yanoikuyae ATCC 51230]SHL43298.1 hypothetical protein SAMN05518668_1013 [Sphingobium sp. YR657]
MLPSDAEPGTKVQQKFTGFPNHYDVRPIIRVDRRRGSANDHLRNGQRHMASHDVHNFPCLVGRV